jgi:hypothetical protein
MSVIEIANTLVLRVILSPLFFLRLLLTSAMNADAIT